jgi:hypothetical protein
LPRNSFFVEAVSKDEELAQAMPESDEPPEERLSTWSPEREVLAACFDRLGEVIRALVAVNGGKPPNITPYPRPVTAMQRARIAKAQERRAQLSKRLLGR